MNTSISTGYNKGISLVQGPKLDISLGIAAGVAIGAKMFGAGLLASTGAGFLVGAGLIKFWSGVTKWSVSETDTATIATPEATTTDPAFAQLQAELDALQS